MGRRSWLSVLILVTTAAPVFSQVASGPTAGEKMPPLSLATLTEATEYKDKDYVGDRKDLPTVYVFIQADKWDRPMFRFVKTLGQNIKKESDQAHVVAVWLSEDRDKTREYLPKIRSYFEDTTLTFFDGEKSGPKDWNINSDAHLTAVVVNKQKVAATFGYQSLNETDAPAVQGALKKALKDK